MPGSFMGFTLKIHKNVSKECSKTDSSLWFLVSSPRKAHVLSGSLYYLNGS